MADHPRRVVSDAETLETLERLWAMDHGLQSVSHAMHAHIGVTGPQRFVLRVIGQSPGLTAGALARTLHDHPSTLTAMLKRLVTLKLVTREGDPSDQRRVRLRLTPAGAAIDQIREGTAEAGVRATLAMVDDADAETFRRVLGLLAAQLDRTAREVTGIAHPSSAPPGEE